MTAPINPARILFAADAADANRMIKGGYAETGDFVFIVSTSLLVVVSETGSVIPMASAASLPAATTSAAGAVLKSTAVVNLTDNSTGTGTGSTIAAVTDVPTAASAIHILALKINELQAAMRVAGQLT